MTDPYVIMFKIQLIRSKENSIQDGKNCEQNYP